MPNWCSNVLSIRHNDPQVIQNVRTAFAKGTFLQEFVPPAVDNHDSRVAAWGTKWDVEADSIKPIENGLTVTFLSAWSPPIEAYEKLTADGFDIRAMYNEPGLAFAGIWEEGSDMEYVYGNRTAAEIAEQLPTELDAEFAISETQAEYEQDTWSA